MTSRMLGGMRTVCYVLAAMALGLFLEQRLAAQEPDDDTIPPGYAFKYREVPPMLLGTANRKNRDELKGIVRDILSGKTPLTPQNKVQFDSWFEKYVFALMTRPKNLPYLSELRQDSTGKTPPAGAETAFFSYFKLIKPDNTAIQDMFTNLTLKNMREIASENYHPAVRHNAMLIIGELNEKEMTQTGGKVPPDPMRAALPVMREELVKPTTPDAVRVACLVGILRHAELDTKRPAERRIPDVDKNGIIKTMLAIVNQPITPGTPGYDGRMWMKRQAMDVLGAFGSVGENGAVFTALEALVGDEKAPTPLRLSAAVALGRLNYPPTQRVDATVLAAKISSVAVAAVQDEVARIKARQQRIEAARSPDFRDPALDNGGVGQIRPMVPPGGAGLGQPMVEKELTDDERRTELAKRRLRQELYLVQQGLTGRTGEGGVMALTKAAPDLPAKFQKAVTDMQVECEGLQSDLDLFSVAIQRHSAALSVILQPVLRPAAGPGAATKPATPDDVLPP